MGHSVDEALDRQLTGDDYRTVRNADEDGQVVTGMRHVRNALGHSQLVTTFTEGGLTLPSTFPIVIQSIVVRWLPADRVVTEWTNPKNRAAYEAFVAEREVSETLYAARRWCGRALRWAENGLLSD